jgi:hypothetical protein
LRKYRHGPTVWERLQKVGWLFAGIGGGLVVTMPAWMLMLGII